MNENANIITLFLQAVNSNADEVALIRGEQLITYEELGERVKTAAARFHDKGISKGSRVLVFVPMSEELYITVLALMYVGAVPVFIDEWVGLDRLKQCCKVVPCQAIVAPLKLLWLTYVVKELRNIPIKLRPGKGASKYTLHEPALLSANETALITFTTGSTGVPKAANRTHGYLHAQFQALRHLVDNTAKRSLITLPIVTLINLALGKTTVLPAKDFSVKKAESTAVLARDIEQYGVSEIITSPAILAELTTRLEQRDWVRKRMLYITTGGGAVFPNLAKQVLKCFGNARCTVVYGSTESEPISELDMKELASLSAEDVLQGGLPVGKLHPSCKVRIIQMHDKEIEPAKFEQWIMNEGEIGEVVVTGAHVLSTYINNPDAERRFKVNAGAQIWHRTGDAASIDESGKLFLFGRCEEVITYLGRRYFPLLLSYYLTQKMAVEMVVCQHKYKLFLVIAAEKMIDERLLRPLLNQLYLDEVQIKYVVKIPKDPRHRTKIDGAKLKALIERE